MMQMSKILVAVLVLGSMVAVFGCRKEGPAERAGKEIDKSVEKAGKEIERAGAKLNDVVNQMKK